MTAGVKVGGVGMCHVCFVRKGVDVFVDGEGHLLLCCTRPVCSVGYTYLHRYVPGYERKR